MSMTCGACGGDLPDREIWEANRHKTTDDCTGSVGPKGRCNAFARDSLWKIAKRSKSLRAKYKRSPAGVKIRRHNGQNGHGPWMRENDSSIPSWVGQLVDEQMIEEGLDEGIVMQGGSYWEWKK